MVSGIKLQDDILSAIVTNSNFPLFDIGQAYKRLKSFDKLLSCIEKAREWYRRVQN